MQNEHHIRKPISSWWLIVGLFFIWNSLITIAIACLITEVWL